MTLARPVDASEAHARALDAADPLTALRDRFELPPGADRQPRRRFGMTSRPKTSMNSAWLRPTLWTWTAS